ncbi:MAG: hypothetical protein IT445_05870 [Phycisphaeraceae bacterium]|nr:hypothetical protein [Phycisphaeraceae bacterium]
MAFQEPQLCKDGNALRIQVCGDSVPIRDWRFYVGWIRIIATVIGLIFFFWPQWVGAFRYIFTPVLWADAFLTIEALEPHNWWILMRTASISSITLFLILFFLLKGGLPQRTLLRQMAIPAVGGYIMGCTLAVVSFYLFYGYWRIDEPLPLGYRKWEMFSQPCLYIIFRLMGVIRPASAPAIESMFYEIILPYYFGLASVVMFYLAVAALWLVPRRRFMGGYCPRCRYDLRGSVGSTECPECGEKIT